MHVNVKLDVALSSDDNLRSLSISNNDGEQLNDKAKRDFLEDLQANGYIYLPLGDCDNFDPKTGCKGHG